MGFLDDQFSTLGPRQDGRHFTDDIFKCIFLNENVWIPIKISLKFVPKGLINNIPALVQIMAWRRRSDKPLSEPMMVSLPTHICVGKLSVRWESNMVPRNTNSKQLKIFVNISLMIYSNFLKNFSWYCTGNPKSYDRRLRCPNYIVILESTPGVNGSGKDNCKTGLETFKIGIWRASY